MGKVRKQILAFSALVIAILILGVIRRPGAWFYPALYFEDGMVFYRDQLVTSAWSLLTTPYAGGYALPIPRIAAFLASCLSPRWAPYVINGAGFVVWSLSTALFSLKRFRPILASDAARIVLCLLFAITFDNTEILASSSNCFWVLGLAVFLLVFMPLKAGSPIGKTLSGVGGAALAYSTPISALAVPFALFGLLRRRRQGSLFWYLGILVGAGIALAIHFSVPQPPAQKFSAVSALVALFVSLADRVVLSATTGFLRSKTYTDAGLLLPPLLALTGFVTLMCFLFLRGDRSTRKRCLLACYILLTTLVVALSMRSHFGTFQQITGPSVFTSGQRYFYLPTCVFGFMVALAAEVIFVRKTGTAQPSLISSQRASYLAVGLTVLAVFSIALCKNFRAKSGPYYPWNKYAEQISNWRHDRDVWLKDPMPTTVRSLVVPIEGPYWHIFLPGNTLSNGDFEDVDIRPWSLFGVNAYLDRSTPESGAQCVRLQEGDGGIHNDLFYLPLKAKYQVSAYARTQPGGTGAAALWVNDQGARDFFDGPKTLHGSDWQRFLIHFEASSTHRMRVALVGKSGVVYWDHVEVTRE